MSAPTKQRFKDIITFMHGSDEFNTIKDVDYEDSSQVLEDSGDGEDSASFLEEGLVSLSGSVTLSDPIQAAAMRAHAKADITFVGVAGTGGTNCLVTLKNCKFFSMSPRYMHKGVEVNKLTFRGHGTAGAASVSTVAPVA